MCPGANAVADHQGEQVGTENAQHAADRGSDQTLQADQTQPPFEDDDGNAEQRPDSGIQLGIQTKGLNQVTSKTQQKEQIIDEPILSPLLDLLGTHVPKVQVESRTGRPTAIDCDQ